MTAPAWGSAEGGEVQLYPTGTVSLFINNIEIKTSGGGLKYLNFVWEVESESFNGFEVNQMIFASSDYLNQKKDTVKEQASYNKWVMQHVNMMKRIFILSGKPIPESMPTPTEIMTLRGCHYDAKLGVEIDQKGKYPDKAKIIDVFPSTFTPPAQEEDQQQAQQEYIPAQQSENPADDIDSDSIPF